LLSILEVYGMHLMIANVHYLVGKGKKKKKSLRVFHKVVQTKEIESPNLNPKMPRVTK
jgi:hypothetical protein